MKIFESLTISEKFVNPVLTIGNYDGIHIGHREIIKRVKDRANAIKGTSMLMTFEPHPMSVLKPNKFIGAITPVYMKKRLIEESGIDVMIIVPFNEEFRNISADTFVKEILVQKIGVKELVVGYDFKFGKDGSGNTMLLQHLSENYGFSFHIVETITVNGEKIGSNRIRRMIQKGEMERVKIFLGRPFMIDGEVKKGVGRGKNMGFPTINISTTFSLLPKNGVYVTETEVEKVRMPSVTNIGYNPTFNENRLSIETYILNFSEELYSRHVNIIFHERIRDEMRFKSVDALRKRIAMDVEIAGKYFGIR
ncbi:MAG TPA: riboflavin biosynthesis protein RibF [Deltaproteobacteria bacterium]|nr:riboflavin biosynthesis protein RibF [Deltaproteobacteria bacterium]